MQGDRGPLDAGGKGLGEWNSLKIWGSVICHV